MQPNFPCAYCKNYKELSGMDRYYCKASVVTQWSDITGPGKSTMRTCSMARGTDYCKPTMKNKYHLALRGLLKGLAFKFGNLSPGNTVLLAVGIVLSLTTILYFVIDKLAKK